jgi:hypothetical protein
MTSFAAAARRHWLRRAEAKGWHEPPAYAFFFCSIRDEAGNRIKGDVLRRMVRGKWVYRAMTERERVADNQRVVEAADRFSGM